MIFIAAVAAQIKAQKFNPALYWVTIIATTTVGTTLADFADRSLGIGYTGGSTLLLLLLLASFAAWYKSLGTVSIDSITTPKAEAFYWVTIMFSQTLGTALGDWMADDADLGYLGSIGVFGGALAVIAALYYLTSVSRTGLFWAAFVMTRPLGAVVGDFFDKPAEEGGLEMDRFLASGLLAAFIIICLVVFRQRAAEKAH